LKKRVCTVCGAFITKQRCGSRFMAYDIPEAVKLVAELNLIIQVHAWGLQELIFM
jgi:hypothetical protein